MTTRYRILAGLALWAAASLSHAAPANYRLDPAQSSLSFEFTQAGAQNKGRFARFDVSLALDPAQPAQGHLDVNVEVGSLDTADKDRDDTLRGADLFNAPKFPRARFTSAAITRIDATHFEAAGKLTIRDVTRDLRVPFTFTPSGAAGSMTGQVVIKRLDFGVGQGDWKSTEWVANDVTVSFALHLTSQP
jgi:polyisoprenoid-binding protein YceI